MFYIFSSIEVLFPHTSNIKLGDFKFAEFWVSVGEYYEIFFLSKEKKSGGWFLSMLQYCKNTPASLEKGKYQNLYQ